MANKTVESDAAFKTYVESLPAYASGTVYMNDDSKYWTFNKQASGKVNSMCINGDNIEIWIYDGTDWIVRTNKTVRVTTPTISSLPVTLYNDEVTSNMVINRVVVNNTAAMLNDWTFNSYDGYFTIAGSIDGSTTIDLDLYEPDHVVTATTTA